MLSDAKGEMSMQTPTAEPSRLRLVCCRAVLVLVTLYTFFPALDGGTILWDDFDMIFTNPFLRQPSLTSLFQLFTQSYMDLYQPLVILSYALEIRLFGVDFFVFHLTNIVLHAANTLLAFELARMLRISLRQSVSVALLFALHPSRVDSTAWISERKDVLFAFFFLSGLLWHMKSLRSGKEGIGIGVVAAFLGSVWSKITAISFPLVLILLERYETGTSYGRLLKRVTPLLLLIIAVFVLLYASPQRTLRVGAPAGLDAQSLLVRAGKVVMGVGFTLRHLTAPGDIPLFVRPLADHVASWPSETVTWMISGLLFFILLRFTRAIVLVQVGLWFFLLTIMPMLGAIFVLPSLGKEFAAIRHAYLPAFGLFLALSEGVAMVLRRSTTRAWNTPALVLSVCFCLVCGAFVNLTRERCRWYDDGVTFWTEVIRQDPSAFAHNLRGMALFFQERFELAREDFRRALHLHSQFEEAWVHLAAVELRLGHATEAVRLMREAERQWPNSQRVLKSLGAALTAVGALDDAVECLARAVRLEYSDAAAWYNYARVLRLKGRADESLQAADKSLVLDPGYPPALLEKAELLEQRGRASEASELRRRATAAGWSPESPRDTEPATPFPR